MCIAIGVLFLGPLLAAIGQCEVNELSKLTGPPGGGFGRSVSVSGDVLVIMGPSTCVFRFDGDNWTLEDKLIPSDGVLLNPAVSVSGDVALIGAVNDDDMGPFTGSAYIFRFNGKKWSQEKKLIGENSGDRFGFSVAVSGDVALVGAVGAGKAFIYRFDGTEWLEEATLTVADATGNFATSVALSGDVAVVGDKGHNGQTGAAYIYRFSGAQWVEEQQLLASDGLNFDGFGHSVSVSGDVALIGSNTSNSSTGSAYIYRFSGAQWVEEQELLAEDAEAGDQFGVSVSISGDVALIGAPISDDAGESSGSAYTFRFTGGEWVQQQKLLASDDEAFDIFGDSVSVFGDVAVVGARLDDAPAGSVYVFTNLSECNTCQADLNGDGIVGPADLAMLLASWGTCE